MNEYGSFTTEELSESMQRLVKPAPATATEGDAETRQSFTAPPQSPLGRAVTDAVDQLTEEFPACVIYDGNKHFRYRSEFTDEEDIERSYVFYFRRLQRMHMVMISKAGKDKAFDSQKEVLVQLALPSQRAEVRQALEQHPAMVSTLADEIFRRAGAGSVFAGK